MPTSANPPINPMYVNEKRPWFISYERYNIKPYIDMPPADYSLIDMFEDSVAKFGDQPAYIFERQVLSYRQLAMLSKNLAGQFQAMGLKQGDRVGVMLPNSLHYPVVAMATILAGLTLVGFNPNYTPRELTHQLTDANIKVLVLLDKFAPTFEQLDKTLLEALQHIIVCQHTDSIGQGGQYLSKFRHALLPTHIRKRLILAKFYPTLRTVTNNLANKAPVTNRMLTWWLLSELLTEKTYQRPQLSQQHTVLVQYTGGTTGVAKGAVLTHGNLIANLLQIDNLLRSAYEEEGQGDIVLTALPLYHVFSFTIGCMLVLYRGFTGLLIANPRHIQTLVAQIRQFPPNYILGVNPLFSGLIQDHDFRQLDFSALKATIGGGMSILPSIAKQWHTVTGLPIIEGYGLSETAPVVTFNPLTIAEFTQKIGIPAPDTDIILIDEHDHPVAIGERGEIAIKGPQVMQGYQNLPIDTAKAFTQQGYFRSGDIGIMDEQGFIKIVDRKKDLMVVSGFNVYPAEIESVMLQHPHVVECAVIGVPSATRGEEPKLFVVTDDPNLTEQDLIIYGKQQLTGYKRPRHVSFVPSLPKSSVGKVLRKALRQREGLE